MGVRPVEAGFSKFTIKPSIGPLNHGSIRVPTVKGSIEMSFRHENEKFRMNIDIPVNTIAIVHIPAEDVSDVLVNGKIATEMSGINFISMENGYAVFEVSSGKYSFVSSRVIE